MIVLFTILFLWLMIAMHGLRESRALCLRARERCEWALRRGAWREDSKDSGEFKPLEDDLRRSGLFLADGWRHCENAFRDTHAFVESIAGLWQQYLTRAGLGWLVVVGCALASARLRSRFGALPDVLILLIPCISAWVFWRNLPRPWFGVHGLRDESVQWLRGMLMDQVGQVPEVEKWRRRELRSGRDYRDARVTAHHFFFTQAHRRATNAFERRRDLMPLFELLGIGVPVLWCITVLTLASLPPT